MMNSFACYLHFLAMWSSNRASPFVYSWRMKKALKFKEHMGTLCCNIWNCNYIYSSIYPRHLETQFQSSANPLKSLSKVQSNLSSEGPSIAQHAHVSMEIRWCFLQRNNGWPGQYLWKALWRKEKKKMHLVIFIDLWRELKADLAFMFDAQKTAHAVLLIADTGACSPGRLF